MADTGVGYYTADGADLDEPGFFASQVDYSELAAAQRRLGEEEASIYKQQQDFLGAQMDLASGRAVGRGIGSAIIGAATGLSLETTKNDRNRVTQLIEQAIPSLAQQQFEAFQKARIAPLEREFAAAELESKQMAQNAQAQVNALNHSMEMQINSLKDQEKRDFDFMFMRMAETGSVDFEEASKYLSDPESAIKFSEYTRNKLDRDRVTENLNLDIMRAQAARLRAQAANEGVGGTRIREQYTMKGIEARAAATRVETLATQYWVRIQSLEGTIKNIMADPKKAAEETIRLTKLREELSRYYVSYNQNLGQVAEYRSLARDLEEAANSGEYNPSAPDTPEQVVSPYADTAIDQDTGATSDDSAGPSFTPNPRYTN